AAYRRYEPAGQQRSYEWVRNGDDETVAKNNYDNGIVEADATIEKLFGKLREKGYLANSLIVILADHGEGLGDHGLGWAGLGHLRTMYQESIRIPLLIYDESDVHYGNLKFATQIDVAPTIVDRLGLRIPPSWEGRSLLSP